MSEDNSDKNSSDENNPVNRIGAEAVEPAKSTTQTGSAYQSESVTQTETNASSGRLVEAKTVDMEAGWQWIVRGFDLFKLEPGLWIGMIVVLGIIMILVSFIPFASPILMPIFSGGLMFVCRQLDQANSPEFGDMFYGFQKQTIPLAILGLINLGASFVIGFIALTLTGVGAGLGAMGGGDGGILAGGILGFLLGVLVMMLLYIPVAMALWFAPALILFHEEIKPVDAMLMSFKACLKNILPFFIYGIVVIVLGTLASIPLGLGWLVLAPVVICSTYRAYQEIFLER